GQKLRILAGLAWGPPANVRLRVAGIGDITRAEVEGATSRSAAIRHVASARRIAGGIELRVERRELPLGHPLARVKEENNAVVIRGRAVGEIAFSGRGAGSLPTAAAVMSDVIELARAS
ncbi:MAG TPA: homoserine dehydrogenase, partial [Thermoanaerobaculia bacterium]